MKLCVAYTVFGTELLSQSVKNIIDVVDKVIICYQEVSNTGIQKPFEWNYEHSPKYHFVKYDTRVGIDTKENERRKHQLMIDTAKKLGCTHFIISATDHFFDPKEIENNKAEAEKYEITFSRFYTYYKNPTWQITPLEDHYMPFICSTEMRILKQVKYPLIVDPSLRIGPYTQKNWHLFPTDKICFHHYSTIRKDIKAKFDSAASHSVRKNITAYLNEFENYDINENPGITYFKGRKVKIVPNYFNL